MRTKVVVIVYNRIDNIKRWIKCWQKCETEGSELIIIHNYDHFKDIQPMQKLATDNQVTYIPRKNIGFDIGAFQDVCRERLEGFDNEYDNLIWCTDDTIPMTRDFVINYIKDLYLDLESNEPNNVGVSCMEISQEYTAHVRTTGFAIRKTELVKLIFPVDPIRTKEHCYQFEHRGRLGTLYHQIKNMGLEPIQNTYNLTDSVVWDIGERLHLNRWQEHNAIFGEEEKPQPKVTFICPIYQSYPQVISSLLLQTHKNWHLLLIHDGPNETNLKAIVDFYNDPRIEYIETEERHGNWGHSLRQAMLIAIGDGTYAKDSDYIVITNGDNWITPNYCEAMLKPFEKNPKAVASYCSKMIHSYQAWDVMDCRLALGHIDCAGVMIKAEAAIKVGWRDIKGHSSDWTYFSDVIAAYGAENWIKVKGCLLAHN